MLFLSPFLLWFAAAAAVPVIIHLINRRRHKTIRWAAMQFLLKAARESRGKKKLRHILILTCRALGLAALAFAAARPIASGLLGWGGGSINTVVLLLDRSASMDAKPGDGLETRRQIVLSKVRDAMADLDGTRLVLIDSASNQPQEVPTPEVLAELAASGGTDTAADLPLMLSRASEFLAENPGRSEIWIASDLQSSNWKPEDERWAAARASILSLPQKPAVRVLSLTGPTAADAAVRLIGVHRSGDELQLDLEVTRSGEARGSATLPLAVHVGGSRTTETLTIPGQTLRLQKTIPLPSGSETGHGWVSLPPDGNERNNAAFFAYGPDRPMKSLIVAAAGDVADYLALAAAPPGLPNLSAERVDPAQVTTSLTPDLAAIFWAAPLPAAGPIADSLTDFLSSGGNVMFFPPGVETTDAFHDLSWSAPAEASAGKFYILNDWNRVDGPLRDGLDGTPLSAHRLKAIKRQIPLGDTMPLARWEDNEPFITRRVFDRGTAWFLGSLPDYTWSNLGDADVLLPAVQRVVTEGADRFDASYLASVNSPAARLAPGETRTRLDDHGTPDPANAGYESGVFRLGERLLALNRPATEDAPEVLGRESLDSVLDGTRYTLLDQTGRTNDPSLSREVWRAFLIAMLFFLLSEALLCLPRKTQLEVLPQKAAA